MNYKIIVSIIFLLCVNSCSYPQQNYGWEKGDLDEVGINSEKIIKLSSQIRNEKYQGIRGIALVKNGKLVYEDYFDGYDKDDLHRIFSVSKSVTSILIGILIDQGKIENVDVPIIETLPQYKDQIIDERKKGIKLKHVLTMTPGFEWHEEDYSYGDKRNSHKQMDNSDDWIKFVLTRDIEADPGKKWLYNTGNSHLLAAIIKNISGMHADKFAEKYLFEPLGIREWKWNSDPNGYPCVGGSFGGLRLKTTDLAKIGQMVLNGGVWNSLRIVTESWIKESTSEQVRATDLNMYGYQWWNMDFRIKGRLLHTFNGSGYGGQKLIIVPELDLVITISSWPRQPDADILPIILRVLNASIIK